MSEVQQVWVKCEVCSACVGCERSAQLLRQLETAVLIYVCSYKIEGQAEGESEASIRLCAGKLPLSSPQYFGTLL